MKWVVMLLIVLAACTQDDATPFPVDIPTTPTPTPPPTAIPPVRYALAANTAGYIAEIDRIQASAAVEQLAPESEPGEPGLLYDIIVAYGEQPGWVRSEITPTVMLVSGETLEPPLIDILLQAVDPLAVLGSLNIAGAAAIGPANTATAADLRVQLANLGQPDGLKLVIGHAYVPGVEQIVAQLTAANIRTRMVVMDNDALADAIDNREIHAALVTWTRGDEHQTWQNTYRTRDLYTLPISYRAVPELFISLTPGGWPLARW
jgi:hypothetical protein